MKGRGGRERERERETKIIIKPANDFLQSERGTDKECMQMQEGKIETEKRLLQERGGR